LHWVASYSKNPQMAAIAKKRLESGDFKDDETVW